MRHIRHIFSHQSGAMLVVALVLAIAVQGLVGATGSCVGMMSDAASETSVMSHEGHDMAGMDMAVHHEGEDADTSYGHVCPPDGCDICEGENCSQCSPSQFNAIHQPAPIFQKDARLAIPDLARVMAFIISSPEWVTPPGRAPPGNL